MAKLDFPPASSSPWKAPTGIIYTYIGNEPNGYWSASASNASEDLAGFFVETAGDNMTGNLTLGPDPLNPTLLIDASNGTLLTDGYFWSQQNTPGLGGCYLFNLTGASRSDAALMVSNTNSASFPSIALNYDGSAQFGQNVVLPSLTSYSADTAKYAAWNVKVDSEDYVLLGGSSSSNLLESNVKIKADGSATLAGTVESSRLNLQGTGSGNILVGYADSTSTSTLQADGSLTLGNLALGGNISLDATDGTARFAGDITVGDNPSVANSNSGVIINTFANGTGGWINAYKGGLRIFDNNGVNSNENISLNADGSAEFGQASNSTNNNGVLIDGNNGALNIYTTRYSTDCFQILNTTGSGTNVAVRFDGDGSASFAGDVVSTDGANQASINAGGTVYVNQTTSNNSASTPAFRAGSTADGTTAEIFTDGSATFGNRAATGDWSINPTTGIRYNSGSAEEIVLSTNGSATFAGYVKTDEYLWANPATVYAGIYNYQNTSTSAKAYIQKDASNIENITFNYDGSAKFAASITSGNGTYTGPGTVISQSGNIYLQGSANDTSSAFVVVNSSNFNAPTAVIQHDGTAIFAGTCMSISGAGNYAQLYPSGLIVNRGGSSSILYTGRNGATGGDVITFSDTGAATFTGTVTANGSVLTRASGDLDVGDRLEKADAALQTLKTAAAASTDFASLKSAIATALANI